MRRDKVTFSMIVGIPLVQLILFGFAINTNPKFLPTALLAGDNSPYTRTFIRGLENTEYFRITHQPKNEKEADNLLATGKVLFVVTIPTDFTKNLIRDLHPQILVEADATDPVASSTALGVLPRLGETVFRQEFTGVLESLTRKPPTVDIVTHARYNPEAITQYAVVPGLLGVVLTMTMIIITSMAITKEREQGTMENLLSTPLRPLEVMLGKILPYVIVGYVQVLLILAMSYYVFNVPIYGSVWLLLFCCLPFIAANLSVGLTFSSLAENQLQASQLAFFFFLPSILLSGFMFPFYGMPQWAQWLGNILPLTHFIQITRGILLKGNDLSHVLPALWPILGFMVVSMYVGVKRYRQTLD